MITAFNHTSFTVKNMNRALEFWTKGLGFQAASVGVRTGDWQPRVTGVPGARIKVAHLYGYGHHLELIEYLNPSGVFPSLQPHFPGAGHICLEVNEIADTVERLLFLGGKMQGEVADINEGSAKGFREVYIRDPEGIIIELLEVPRHDASPSSGAT